MAQMNLPSKQKQTRRIEMRPVVARREGRWGKKVLQVWD